MENDEGLLRHAGVHEDMYPESTLPQHQIMKNYTSHSDKSADRQHNCCEDDTTRKRVT